MNKVIGFGKGLLKIAFMGLVIIGTCIMNVNKKNKVWGTSIEREFAEEIDAFLKKHGLKKVELIYEGYNALVNQYEKQNE